MLLMKRWREFRYRFIWSFVIFLGCLSTWLTYWIPCSDTHGLMHRWQTFRFMDGLLWSRHDIEQCKTGLRLFILVETCFKQPTWQPITRGNGWNHLTSWMKDESCVSHRSAALNMRLMIRSNGMYWRLVTPCCILDWERAGIYHGWVPRILTQTMGTCTVKPCDRAGFRGADKHAHLWGWCSGVPDPRGASWDTQHLIVFLLSVTFCCWCWVYINV